jgi:archaellum component FlaC
VFRKVKKITVKKGQGIFDGKWAILDADMPMDVPSPHVSYNRIDSVIVRIDNSDDVRAGAIVYKQGEAALDPVPIELENNNYVKEYRLAKILIPANAATLSDSNITDCRPTSECGFIHNLLWDSDITTTYAQWEAQFTEWLDEKKTMLDDAQVANQETFDTTQENNQNTFDEWFDNVKETLASATLIRSFTSRYVTKTQDETIIPIQIPEFKSYIDILQVYINGLICIKDVDYTIDGFENIILKNGVDYGTEVSFIVYKSMDGSNIDKFIENVDDLIERQNSVETDLNTLSENVSSSLGGFESRVGLVELNYEEIANELESTTDKTNTATTNITNLTTKVNTANTNINNLTTKVNTATSNITNLDNRIDALEVNNANTALWNGANTLGSGEEIRPSKALSACKNGWLLVFCGYNTSTNLATNTRFNTVFVNKGIHTNIPGTRLPLYCNMIANHFESGNVDYVAKSLNVYDDRIEGAVQNTLTDLGKAYCLRFVFEF